MSDTERAERAEPAASTGRPPVQAQRTTHTSPAASADVPVTVDLGRSAAHRMDVVRAQLEHLFPPAPFPVHVGYGPAPDGWRVVDAWHVVPSRSAPRFLLPTDGAAARSVLLSHNGLRPPRTRLLRAAAAYAATPLGLLQGTGGVLHVAVPRGVDDAAVEQALITRHLRRLVPTSRASALSLRDFHPRAKPTVVLTDADARVVGFAKVASDGATGQRVHAEAHLLRTLAPVLDRPGSPLRLPDVLAAGRCGSFAYSVVAPLPLPVRRVRRDDEPAVLRALASFARAGSGDHADPYPPVSALGGTRLWQSVMARVETARAARGARPDLVAALERLAAASARDGDVEVAVGAYHGDWVPWNMAWDGEQDLLWVWDLEYGDLEGPVGLDALRWEFQVRHVLDRVSLPEAVAAMHEAAARVLPPLDVDPALASVLVRLHLVETFATALDLLATGRGLPRGLDPDGVAVLDAAR